MKNFKQTTSRFTFLLASRSALVPTSARRMFGMAISWIFPTKFFALLKECASVMSHTTMIAWAPSHSFKFTLSEYCPPAVSQIQSFTCVPSSRFTSSSKLMTESTEVDIKNGQKHLLNQLFLIEKASLTSTCGIDMFMDPAINTSVTQPRFPYTVTTYFMR